MSDQEHLSKQDSHVTTNTQDTSEAHDASETHPTPEAHQGSEAPPMPGGHVTPAESGSDVPAVANLDSEGAADAILEPAHESEAESALDAADAAVAATPEADTQPPASRASQHQQANRLAMRVLAGALGLLVLTWVLFPLIRGGSSQQIQAAETAIQELYLSSDRSFLAPDVSENQLAAAKAKVQALSGWSGYRLMRDYEAAEQRYQAIQALGEVYASDQPLIQGDQVNHQAPLKEGVTAETVQTLTQAAAIRQVGTRDALGQAIQGLLQEASQVFTQADSLQSSIASLNLSTQFDRDAIGRDVAAIQAIERELDQLAVHTDTQDLRDQLAAKVKDFAQLVAAKATDTNLSADTIEALWASPSLAAPLSGSAIDHRKLMTLTFDDGPHPEVTEELLKVLDKHQVKATFFMMGGFVEKYPEIARKVRDAGHQIGNHTYTHPDMAKESDEGVKKQIQYAQEAIEEATGVTPTIYRLPFGSGGERVVKLLKPMTSIVWNVDSEDWKSHDKDAIVEQVLTHLQPRSVLLMHDTHISTVEAIDVLIPIFKEKGYQFVMPQENDLGYYYY